MSTALTATIIDDTDSRAKYSPGWHMDGGPNEYNRTVHATSTAGASFTLKFNGTSVKVMGTLTQDGSPGSFPNTSYVLDGSTPITFSGKPSAQVLYSQIFYQSPVELPDTEHVLIGTCIDQGSLVWIDFFVVTSLSTTTALSTPTISESMVVVTTTVATSQDSSRSSSTSTEFPVGAVVGSVLGGIFLVLVFMSLLLWHRRRPVSTIATEMSATPYTADTSMTSLIGRPPPLSIHSTHAPSTSSAFSSPSPIDVPSLASASTMGLQSPSTVPSGSSRKLRPMQPFHVVGGNTSHTPMNGNDLERGDYPPAYH